MVDVCSLRRRIASFGAKPPHANHDFNTTTWSHSGVPDLRSSLGQVGLIEKQFEVRLRCFVVVLHAIAMAEKITVVHI